MFRLILCRPASGYKITRDDTRITDDLKKLKDIQNTANVYGLSTGEAAAKVAKALAKRVGESEYIVSRCNGVAEGINKGNNLTIAFVTAHEDVAITFSVDDKENPMYKKAISLLSDIKSSCQKELDEATTALNIAFK